MIRFMSRSRTESRQTTADRAFKPVPHQELPITQLRQDYATGHQRLGTGQCRRLHITLPHSRHGLNTCLLIIHTTNAGLRLANHKFLRPAVMLRAWMSYLLWKHGKHISHSYTANFLVSCLSCSLSVTSCITTLCFKKKFTLFVFTITKSDVDQFCWPYPYWPIFTARCTSA